MDEHHDEIDTWLSQRVQPLLPAPGTFEQVRREARRRRLHRVSVLSASAAVIVAAAAVVIPNLATLTTPPGRPAASGGATARPSSHASPAPVSQAVPADFTPTSVTFVGNQTGWVLGRTASGRRCGTSTGSTCLARTDDSGATWRPVTPPPANGPSGASGVSQIRFQNLEDGWAFGPQLWATHDSGATWTRVPTHGMRVIALEARNGRVFAIWAHCTGTGAHFAAGCSSFSLWSAPAGGNHWAQVAGVGTLPYPRSGGGGSPQLVLTNSRGYLLQPAGSLYSGPVTGNGAWQPVAGNNPCAPSAALNAGHPLATGLLASTGQVNGLALLCPGAPSGAAGTGRTQGKPLYLSSDGGQFWSPPTTPGGAIVPGGGAAPTAGVATSLAGTPGDMTIVLATTDGIDVSTNGGGSWQAARGSFPPGGFAYVGMTTSSQGVAIPAGPGQHSVWFTYDGGLTWRPAPLG